jgi:hypothetical protein
MLNAANLHGQYMLIRSDRTVVVPVQPLAASSIEVGDCRHVSSRAPDPVRRALEGNHIMDGARSRKRLGFESNVAIDQHIHTGWREFDLIEAIAVYPNLLDLNECFSSFRMSTMLQPRLSAIRPSIKVRPDFHRMRVRSIPGGSLPSSHSASNSRTRVSDRSR